MKKKVLFLITKATWGGAQKYVYDLATHLPKEQFEPVVAYGESGKLSEDLVRANIRTFQVRSLGRDVSIFSDIKSFWKIYKGIGIGQPDVVHLNSSKAAALGALAARLAGVKKIIFTVHGWPFKENRNFISRWAIFSISWFTAVLSHQVVVVSITDKEVGERMPGVKNKIRLIYIGIEQPQFLSRDQAAASLSISTSMPRIVTIAELTANKGIGYEIEAIAELKRNGTDIVYFIIGDGEQRPILEQLVHEKDVVDRVRFLGFIENAATYLRAFDAFVLPSLKEGMPYVLLEAASAGLPIVATDVVDTAYSIRVQPGDTGALAEASRKILETRVQAAMPFSLQEMLKETMELY